MLTAELTQPAKCSTGNPIQQLVCGWNKPVNTSSVHAAGTAGHDARPFVVFLLVALAVFFVLKLTGKGRRATAQGS